MKDETASIVAETLYREWICRFGPAERLLPDRGSAFTGDVMARLGTKLGIKNVFTSLHHPHCDGMVERWNRTLLKDLRGYVDPDDKNWAELLPSACLRYNTSRHSATGSTPFTETFGAEAFDWDTELGLREQLLVRRQSNTGFSSADAVFARDFPEVGRGENGGWEILPQVGRGMRV
jgi:hypothetical protein